MRDDELEQLLRDYCNTMQSREPPGEQMAETARYVLELNEAVRKRADRDPLLSDPASFRDTLMRYAR